MFVFLKYPLYEYQRLSFAKSENYVFDNIENYKVIRFLKLNEEDKNYILSNIINNYDFIALCLADKKRMNTLEDGNEITFLNLYYSMRKEENDLLIKNLIRHCVNYVLLNKEANNMYIRFSTRKTYKTIVDMLLEIYIINFNTIYKRTFIDNVKQVQQKEEPKKQPTEQAQEKPERKHKRKQKRKEEQKEQQEEPKEEIITENGRKFKIIKTKSGLTIKRPI